MFLDRRHPRFTQFDAITVLPLLRMFVGKRLDPKDVPVSVITVERADSSWSQEPRWSPCLPNADSATPSRRPVSVYATGRLMWWDSKLSLFDQRDGQVFMTLNCNIPTTRGFQVVTDERTPVLVENRLKNVKVLRCHVGHTIGSLSTDVREPRTATGSRMFPFFS